MGICLAPTIADANLVEVSQGAARGPIALTGEDGALDEHH